MHARARLLVAVGLGILLPVTAAAQGPWVPHQAPCRLNTGHYLVNGGILQLKHGVESQYEDARARRVAEALRILHEAILEKDQGENAAAWYYLGRAYVLGNDLAGADSAFRRAVDLAPVCADDIAQYRAPLATLALTAALRTWGAGAHDSAVAFFRLARSLDAADAEIPLYASMMYASLKQPDSAARYLEAGLAATRTDSAHATRLRQAHLEVARAYQERAQTSVPAVQTVAQTRFARDTTARQIARDSTLLDRIVSEVAAMGREGGRLTPQARAAYERDSTLLADRLAAGRAARESLSATAAADSAAVTTALAPAAAAYAAYTARYPDDADGAVQLLRVAIATGDRAALASAVDQLSASPGASSAATVQGALSLYGDGLYDQARRLTTAALAHNPNDHAVLGIATHVNQALGDGAALLATARQRLALAPLDPAAARAVALGHDLAGSSDSATRWLAMADTGLVWNVHVSQFQPTEHAASLNGYVRNAVPRALPALELVFEFLAADGAAVATTPVSIPALEPNARAPLSVRAEQGGVVSWRYKRP